MKFSPICRTNKPTSYHAVFGCREARQMNLLDENGKEREVIFVPMNGGVFLAPVLEKSTVLEYRGFRTEVCSNGKFFFGKLLFLSQNVTWRATDAAKAEASFHSAVDRFLAAEDELPK